MGTEMTREGAQKYYGAEKRRSFLKVRGEEKSLQMSDVFVKFLLVTRSLDQGVVISPVFLPLFGHVRE